MTFSSYILRRAFVFAMAVATTVAVNGGLKMGSVSQAYLESKAVKETRSLISELCRQFYNLGWVSGTGGSITLKVHDSCIPKPQQLILMSPSGTYFSINHLVGSFFGPFHRFYFFGFRMIDFETQSCIFVLNFLSLIWGVWYLEYCYLSLIIDFFFILWLRYLLLKLKVD